MRSDKAAHSRSYEVYFRIVKKIKECRIYDHGGDPLSHSKPNNILITQWLRVNTKYKQVLEKIIMVHSDPPQHQNANWIQPVCLKAPWLPTVIRLWT
jgi:hypothetical protein